MSEHATTKLSHREAVNNLLETNEKGCFQCHNGEMSIVLSFENNKYSYEMDLPSGTKKASSHYETLEDFNQVFTHAFEGIPITSITFSSG